MQKYNFFVTDLTFNFFLTLFNKSSLTELGYIYCARPELVIPEK